MPPPPPPPPVGPPTIDVQRVFDQLSFNSPVALLQAPGDSTRWFAVEQSGIVRVFDNDQNVTQTDVFVDIAGRVTSGGERGLLGMAFHPDFANNGQVFLSYTGGVALTSFVSRFTLNQVTGSLDPNSEDIVITVLQDQGNHNGGNIAFGPDGMLYIGFGDGGGAGDPGLRGQDTMNLLGTILRLDVDGIMPYEVPPDNLFFAPNTFCDQGFGGVDCPEIYAWGFRNPWRFSFDRVTGDLWVGDVGQNSWEEIDRVESGLNYGWNEREGAHCFAPTCMTDNEDPITEYANSGADQSVTGGVVYRGTVIVELQGYYVFGDFGSGIIRSVPADSIQGVAPDELLDTTLAISSFAEGNDGEIYVLDYFDGGVYQIVDAP
jgi:glucose/arabinose dehydrogenase